MRYVIALFFPWLTFFTMGKVIHGVICLIGQIFLIGWIPATIWAMVTIHCYHADKRTGRIEKAIMASRQA